MLKPCSRAIHQQYSVLTSAERKVADFILANSEKIVMMTISELAEQVGVAKSAVVRCCQTLGFDGYSHLKIAMSAEISKNKQLNYTPYIYPRDNVNTVLDKVFSANAKAIHDTVSQLDRGEVIKSLNAIRDAKNIYIYGIGTSSSLVLDFQYRLMQMGYTAFAYSDPPTMKISTLSITKDDVVIGISHSGRTISTIDAIKLAVQNGAQTICITGYTNSPITKISDHAIVVGGDEIRYPVEAMSSKIAQMNLIYAMTVALSSMDYEKTVQRARQSRKLVDTVRLEEDG